MKPIQLLDPASSTYTYILFDKITRDAVIIDPVASQVERDQAVLSDYGLTLRWTLQTHAHTDHLSRDGQQGASDGATSAAVQLQDGEVLAFGHQQLIALHTPGHTTDSMCYLWQGHVMTGDTLLINGCGRTDFPSGSADALYDSLTGVLFALPPETIVWPGHDYQGRHYSTIGREKASNARVADKTREAFVASMQALDVPISARQADALPLNPASGLRHDADAVALMQVRPAQGYAGDVSPQLAYQWFLSGEAVLVDVRTDAEREWVGFVPGAVPLAWKQWPGMAVNPGFDEALKAAVPSGHKVVLLCRSGVRSIAAAKRATEVLGLQAYNILEGFEGDPNGQAHRNLQGGWRYRGLPWRQN